MAIINNEKLSVLFKDIEITQWGLRGDPFLWSELKELADLITMPQTEKELVELLKGLTKAIIGEDLQADKDIAVPRFNNGGMSGGYVSSAFWLKSAFPILIAQFANYKALSAPLPIKA